MNKRYQAVKTSGLCYGQDLKKWMSFTIIKKAQSFKKE